MDVMRRLAQSWWHGELRRSSEVVATCGLLVGVFLVLAAVVFLPTHARMAAFWLMVGAYFIADNGADLLPSEWRRVITAAKLLSIGLLAALVVYVASTALG
jgi:hypothetical protein